jgi:hypothetical protein
MLNQLVVRVIIKIILSPLPQLVTHYPPPTAIISTVEIRTTLTFQNQIPRKKKMKYSLCVSNPERREGGGETMKIWTRNPLLL